MKPRCQKKNQPELMKLSKSPSFDEDWMYHQLLLTINISKIPSVLTKKSTGEGEFWSYLLNTQKVNI